MHYLSTEITHLVFNAVQVLYVSSQKEFSERQSDIYKVGFFTEKHTPQIDRGPSQKARDVPGSGVVNFCRGG